MYSSESNQEHLILVLWWIPPLTAHCLSFNRNCAHCNLSASTVFKDRSPTEWQQYCSDTSLHVQCAQSRSLKSRILQCCIKLSRWEFFHLRFHPEHHHLKWTSLLEQITKSIEMTTMFLLAQHKMPIPLSSH